MPPASTEPPSFDLADYHGCSDQALRARGAALPGPPIADLAELVLALIRHEHRPGSLGTGGGILDVRPEGFGFLRHPRHRYRAGADDLYLAGSQIHHLGLRPGSWIAGTIRLPRPDERYPAMVRVATVDGRPVAAHRQAPPRRFAARTAVLPRRQLVLAAPDAASDLRVAELLAPVAHGHRILIHGGRSPWPHWNDLAAGLRHGQPAARLVGLMVGQPTGAAQRLLPATADDPLTELFVTSVDEPAARDVELLHLVQARVQRLVEGGADVVLLVDGLDRLVRAAAATTPYGGPTVVDDLDCHAFRAPRELLALARQLETGPALTVFAAVAAGDPAAAAITAQFAGSCQAELVFDPELDVHRTGTRPEACPLPPTAAATLHALRSRLLQLPAAAARQRLLALAASAPDRPTLWERFREA